MTSHATHDAQMRAAMPAVDTSAAAVERLAAHYDEEGKFMEVAIGAGDVDGHRYGSICRKTAAKLRALSAEVATLRQERDAARRVVQAAHAYYKDYCVDEADSPDCCVEKEQHYAAAELRDALRALLTEPRNG